jgi:hypothetical protein
MVFDLLRGALIMNGNLGSGPTVNRPVKEGNPYLA